MKMAIILFLLLDLNLYSQGLQRDEEQVNASIDSLIKDAGIERLGEKFVIMRRIETGVKILKERALNVHLSIDGGPNKFSITGYDKNLNKNIIGEIYVCKNPIEAQKHLFRDLVMGSAPHEIQVSSLKNGKFLNSNIVGNWCAYSKKKIKDFPAEILFVRENISIMLRSDGEINEMTKLAQMIDELIQGKLKAEDASDEIKKKIHPDYRAPKIETVNMSPLEVAGLLPRHLQGILQQQKVSVAKMSELLKLEAGEDKQLVPNPHIGKVTLAALKDQWLIGEITQNIAEPTMGGFVLWDEKKRAKMMVAVVYASSRKQAQEVMLTLKLTAKNPGITPEALEAMCRGLRLKAGLAGDLDLSLRPVLDDDMNPVPGTGESELYFLRGNTVVALMCRDPKESVLRIAKEIDNILKK